MKKYNIANYIRYKEDIKISMPIDKDYQDYTRDEMIVKFLPLVEAMAKEVFNISTSFRYFNYKWISFNKAVKD